MKIVFTGATGYIGKKLVKRLAGEKHEIYAIVRRESDTKEIQDKVKGLIYIYLNI